MKASEVTVGTILKMREGGGEYEVVEINGDEIVLESTKIVAGMDVFLEDLPEMFEGVSA